MLQFCVSQQTNKNPYIFRSTGIRVYSFEEALYHVFHYWRESVDDFLSAGMFAWVRELGHSFIASKMNEIAEEENLTARILGFLQLANYFSQDEITGLQLALEVWERRCEWEKLKERADYFTERGEPFKALPLYKRALELEENVALLNNIGVAYMQLSLSKKAANHLSRAHVLSPRNIEIVLHYTEAAILSKQYEIAGELLEKAESLAPNRADIPFLRGLMAFRQKNYPQALNFYEKAAKLEPETSYYIYKMADVYKEMRQFRQAMYALEKIELKDAEFYIKEAEIHAAAGDVPASLRSMRTAANDNGTTNANLLAKLAEYYRQDYDWRRAEKTISQALELSPDNDKARIESARIKKGLGRTREYQNELSGIINKFKERYRAYE
jgi:tetratricopeptide (TPR) repeat protein